MKKLAPLSALILLFVSSLGFAATLHSLSKDQVTKALQDKTMTTIGLVTINGQLVNNAITISLTKDGKLTGQFANKPDNAPQSDQGTWTVKSNGVLCTTWQNLNSQKPICVFVYKLNNGLVFVNTETGKFESMALSDNIKDGSQNQAQVQNQSQTPSQ